jgi:hypothetical protein
LQPGGAVYFPTKNPNFGKFWRALEWKMLVYVMTIFIILRPFGIIYNLYRRLEHFSHFGMFGPRKIWQPCPVAVSYNKIKPKLQVGDVIIPIFCDFRQFSAKKLAFFSKTML